MAILTRLAVGFARWLLVLVTLAVALVAGGAVVVPLAVLAPPLPLILAGLLVVYVLGATRNASSPASPQSTRSIAWPAVPKTSTQTQSPWGKLWPSETNAAVPPESDPSSWSPSGPAPAGGCAEAANGPSSCPVSQRS